MLQLRLLGIPVLIQPWFFLTAALIGPRDLPGLALWVPVVLAGVLAHELGHALAALRYGRSPTIVLHGFGGATSWGGARLSPGRRIAVTAAGPAVGLAIGAAALAAAHGLSPVGTPARLLSDLVWVNLGWAVLNLLPILPLDGGAMVAVMTEALWGARGLRIAHLLSLVACVALAGAALWVGWWWSAIIAGMLALANVQALRGDGRPRPLG